jgi:hypothetical protein
MQRTRAPLPTRMHTRADTRRLFWLNQEDGEENVLRSGRNRQRNERAPLLRRACACRSREHRHPRQRDHARRGKGQSCGCRIATLSRGGTATVRLCLTDHARGGGLVAIRFVHRTGRAVHAARHPRLRGCLPPGAHRDVPDEQGQDCRDSRNPPEHGHHVLRMLDRLDSVKCGQAA